MMKSIFDLPKASVMLQLAWRRADDKKATGRRSSYFGKRSAPRSCDVINGRPGWRQERINQAKEQARIAAIPKRYVCQDCLGVHLLTHAEVMRADERNGDGNKLCPCGGDVCGCSFCTGLSR